MKKRWSSLAIIIIGIFMTGCSVIGPDGTSKIIFMEDGLGDLFALPGETYSVDLDI